MRIKVKCIGSGKEGDPYRADVKYISWTAVEYNYKDGWVIIEISKEDFEKIKDKVLEIIEK